MKARSWIWQTALLGAVLCWGSSAPAEIVLVRDGVSLAPIVIFENAPPKTRRAADELAEYIEKTSGARPVVLEGRPEPIPENAVWVGYQPVLEDIFPNLDFDFQHPEEILIAANEQHLVIAGRDRWDPDNLTLDPVRPYTMAWGPRQRIEGMQQEFGTANAVYTFLQDYLGVRWLWPGELGEDIVRQDTIAFSPFEHRHRPPFQSRAILMLSRLGSLRSGGVTGLSHDWGRFQRIHLDSLQVPAGHGFPDWWELYHETHPEYFAMQPDGTRNAINAVSSPGNVKLCLSNPAVWAQTIANMAESLEANPNLNVFNVHENDGHSSGICICQNCLAWDHPEGATWLLRWQGLAQDYVAMTDRYITFWNRLAEMVREDFPDRDDLFLFGYAYGPTTPFPVEAKFDERIIYGQVGHFPFTTDQARREQKEEWAQWAELAHQMIYRPNLWYFGVGNWGLPEVAMTRTIEDFRFLADNRCVGIWVDGGLIENWAVKGPQYYLMAQLAYDPHQDGNAVLADYYRRGFGDAAPEIEAYWAMMEQATDDFMNGPGATRRIEGQILTLIPNIFTDDFLRRADGLLQSAEAKLQDGPDLHRERLAFVRAGLESTRLMVETIPVMTRVRESEGRDTDAVKQAVANWEAIEQIERDFGPEALHLARVRARMGGGYRGGVQDYFGPPKDEFLRAADLIE